MENERGYSSVFVILVLVCSVAIAASWTYFQLKDQRTLLFSKILPEDNAVVTTPVQQNTTNPTPAIDVSEKPVCEALKVEIFEVKVSAGDGVTNIARKALTQYFNSITLSELNGVTLRLNSEESVYAEDFIRRAVSFPPLSVNEIVEIPCTVVEKATLAAQAVTDMQKRNLEKYGNKVPEYLIDDIIQENLNKLYETNPDLKDYSGLLKIGH